MISALISKESTSHLGMRPSPDIDIADPGHLIAVEWHPVAGATSVEVTSAVLRLSPSVVVDVQEDVPFQADGAGWKITVPANRRIAAIGLQGFKRSGEAEITSATNLPAGRRISVAFPPVDGAGFDTPRYSVPAVNRQGAVPSTLTGASYFGRALTLDRSVAAAKTRVALVSGETPNEFSDEATELSAVSVTTHATARNLQVAGPAGEILWEVAEFDPEAAEAEADLTQALAAALNKQIRTGAPLRAEFIVKADAPAKAVVRFSGAHGFVVRTKEGVTRSVLTGEPVLLALSGLLDSSLPNSVTGDLTVRYNGIRILEEASDELPKPGAPVSGPIVGSQSGLRVFPPLAFAGASPARVGIYGRAPEGCELALEFVEITGNTIGATISPPAVLTVEPDSEVKTRWAVLPARISIARPAGLRVRANTGRFYWVANALGDPIVRVAILDPDPAGRPVHLGGDILSEVAELTSHQPAFHFTTSAFAASPPALLSDLFLTVDISDLTLRYAR